MMDDAENTAQKWLKARKEFQDYASQALGERNAQLLINQGKFFNAGDLSGLYFSSILDNPANLPELKQLVDRLVAGDILPIMLMHKYYPSKDLAYLQYTQGTLELVYSRERRIPA